MATASSAPTPLTPASTRGIDRILALTELFRLPSSLLAGIAGYATTYSLNPALPLPRYFLTAAVLFCMTAAACAINDYWDIDKDCINHPNRPLPANRLSPQNAWWAAIVLFTGALAAALPLGIYPVLLVALSSIVLWHYSHLLNYSGILGNIIVAATIALLIFLSSLVADRPFVMHYPIAFLFCYALAREILFDVHDAEGDRLQGVQTIANQWGTSAAFLIIWSLLGGLFVSLPIALLLLPMQHPILFGSFATILLMSLALPLAIFQRSGSEKDYDRLLFWERWGLLFGGLGLLGAAPSL